MSASEFEEFYSKEELRSGLMKFTLERPEHKLRDLARNLLGITSFELSKLDIHQVSQLFFARRMTFTFDQIANIAYRRVCECGVNKLFKPSQNEDLSGSDGKILFFAHDENGKVSVVTMEDQGDYFPCRVTNFEEGALFENPTMPVILRHPNPHILWKLRSEKKITSQTTPDTVLQLGEAIEITVTTGAIFGDSGGKRNMEIFGDKVLDAYTKQNLKVKIGFGILAPQWQRSDDERPLFGFPKDANYYSHFAYLIDSFVAEIRGAMAQMGENVELPPQTSEMQKSIRDWRIQSIVDNGFTFSIREAGLFMHNTPRLGDGEMYTILVHDEEGEVFTLTIRYKDRKIYTIEVAFAYQHSKLNDWSSGNTLCLRMPFVEGTVVIAPSDIIDHTGKYYVSQ
jgi:hypothetical protein